MNRQDSVTVEIAGESTKPQNPAPTGKSHPFFVQKVQLHSFHAQQVFGRGFDVFAPAVFSLSVVLRIIGTDEQAQEIETLVNERLNKLVGDLRADLARLGKLAEANGIEFQGVDYSNPQFIEAKITSPRAVHFIALIREFDELVARLDTLWLSGLIPDENYSRSLYEWKRRILRLAVSIRSIAGRAMVTARRKAQEAPSGAALPIQEGHVLEEDADEDNGDHEVETPAAPSESGSVA